MRLYGNGVFLGCNQRTGKDGKVYTNVNVDFDGEILSIGTQDISPFLQLEKYRPYVFSLFYGTYHGQDGRSSAYLRIEGVQPSK